MHAGVSTPERRRARLESEFQTIYGQLPVHWVRSPARIDAMGSHTDYNKGLVLTVPIDRDTWVAARLRTDRRVLLASTNMPERVELDLQQLAASPAPGWSIYVKGVLAELTRAGIFLPGCELLVDSTIPLGSGLSSSASLEAAIATLFVTWAEADLAPVALAQLCQRAENIHVGVQCGILDQYSVLCGEAGHLVQLDCRSLRHQQVPLPASLLPVVCNTRAPRSLATSAYGERRADCERVVAEARKSGLAIDSLRDLSLEQLADIEARLSHNEIRRATFVLNENARVLALAQALREQNKQAIGQLFSASFAGAKKLYEITVPAMEAMERAARLSPGIVGVRQAGAGFGGCLVALVEREQVGAFVTECTDSYRRLSGIEGQVFAVKSANGASMLNMSSCAA